MILGFHAGADPNIGVTAGDYLGTRRAWGLPDGHAPIGRVFPAGAAFGPTDTPTALTIRVARACASALAAGMVPFPSLKPDPAALLAGQLDQHLTAVAQYLTTLGQPTYFTVHHEPENDQFGYGPTDYRPRALRWVAAYCYAYELVKSVAGDRVLMGPVHLGYLWGPNRPQTTGSALAAAWRVPDGYRDWWGIDSYTSNTTWGIVGQTLAVKSDFQRWMTTLGVPAGEILLAERGITGNYPAGTVTAAAAASQAVTLRADYDYLTTIGAHGMLAWNSGGATDSSVYLLGADARSIFTTIASDAALRVSP